MSDGEWFEHVDRPPGEALIRIGDLADGGIELEVAAPSSSDMLPLTAVCRRCRQPMQTGTSVHRREIPVEPVGQWRCIACGGPARLPDRFTVIDVRSRERLSVVGPARVQGTLSAITLAELLRLAQAARAVQAGRPGATDRLDRVLAESPEPIRRLRDRMGPAEWIALAALIVTLVQVLTGIVKDDGQVTEQQLVDVIERLVDDQSTSQEQ